MWKSAKRVSAFANKVAIVTGASSGIGWSLARLLAVTGSKVGVMARRKEPLEQLAQEIRQAGGTVALEPADVGDRAQVLAGIARLTAQLGPVDLLVANAGVGLPTTIEPLRVEDVETLFRINFFGVVYAIEAVLPAMLERRQGHLAAVSSLGAYKGIPGSSAYCASKAAVNTFLEGLRIQLRERGIAVTTICPGFVRTPMTSANQSRMPWLMEPDEAARRILRALERRKKVFAFPRRTAWLLKLAAYLPDWMWAQQMRRYRTAD